MALVIAIFLAFIVQEFIPPLEVFRDARVLFVPMLFCYGALALPFWAMLLLAVYTGLLSDLAYLNVVGGQVEIAVGWSIFFYVLLGMLVHGFEPAFRRGGWWLHPIFSAVLTSLYLALQFVMISFRRSGFEFHDTILWLILAPGVMAALFAPLIHLIAWQGSQFLPADVHRGRGYRGTL